MATKPIPICYAYLSDAESRDAFTQFAKEQEWENAQVMEGTIDTAIDALKGQRSPSFLVVDIPDADAAAKQLNRLADVCEPHVHVIVAGSIDNYRFYQDITALGVEHYLLKPFNAAQIAEALRQLLKAVPPSANDGAAHGFKPLHIAITGTSGGIGTSLLALNMAGIAAFERGHQTVLVDADLHYGSISLALDLEPGRGFRDLVEKPNRVDALYIERVLSKVTEEFHILSAEEPLEMMIQAQEESSDVLLRELTPHYPVIISDVPRRADAFTHGLLIRADIVIVVTQPDLGDLRDAMRIADMLKHNEEQRQLFVMNKQGLPGFKGLRPHDYEKNLGHKIHTQLAYEPKLLDSRADRATAFRHLKKSKTIQAIRTLTESLIPQREQEESATPKTKGWRKTG